MIICDLCQTGEDVKPVELEFRWWKNASQFSKIIRRRDLCPSCEKLALAKIEEILKARFRGINESE